MSDMPTERRPLKVVHLCSSDTGGAGKGAHRLHRGLLAAGIDSSLLVIIKRSTDPTVKLIPVTGARPAHRMPEHAGHLPFLGGGRKTLAGYPGTSSPTACWAGDVLGRLAGVNLDVIREIREADIVNLHWGGGNGKLRLPGAGARRQADRLTLHDMNPFTGGCHYTAGCERYRSICRECPSSGLQIARTWPMTSGP